MKNNFLLTLVLATTKLFGNQQLAQHLSFGHAPWENPTLSGLNLYSPDDLYKTSDVNNDDAAINSHHLLESGTPHSGYSFSRLHTTTNPHQQLTSTFSQGYNSSGNNTWTHTSTPDSTREQTNYYNDYGQTIHASSHSTYPAPSSYPSNTDTLNQEYPCSLLQGTGTITTISYTSATKSAQNTQDIDIIASGTSSAPFPSALLAASHMISSTAFANNNITKSLKTPRYKAPINNPEDFNILKGRESLSLQQLITSVKELDIQRNKNGRLPTQNRRNSLFNNASNKEDLQNIFMYLTNTAMSHDHKKSIKKSILIHHQNWELELKLLRDSETSRMRKPRSRNRIAQQKLNKNGSTNTQN